MNDDKEVRGMRERRVSVVIAIAACCFFAGSCGKKPKRVSTPATPRPASPSSPRRSGNASAPLPIGYKEEGIASWYGIPYHGRRAADGEVYDMETLVAAHRIMPFNTWVRVTNESNGKAVIVRIIDRGPFVDGRIIDLSKAAARNIGLLGPGVGRVRLEVVAAPANIPEDDFFAVQVGAFTIYDRAEKLRALCEQRYGIAKIVGRTGPAPLWRVLVGKEASEVKAQTLANTIGAEMPNVFVVRLDEKLPTPQPNPPPAVWQTPETIPVTPADPRN